MKKQYLLDTSMVISVIAADQVLKAYIETTNLGIHDNVLVETTLIPNFLALTKLYNNGAAWSFMEGNVLFFYLVTIAALPIIMYAYKKATNSLMKSSLALVFAGTIGNFLDRLLKGYVVDMFDFKFINFPIFNIADIALCVGVALLFVTIILDKDMD